MNESGSTDEDVTLPSSATTATPALFRSLAVANRHIALEGDVSVSFPKFLLRLGLCIIFAVPALSALFVAFGITIDVPASSPGPSGAAGSTSMLMRASFPVRVPAHAALEAAYLVCANQRTVLAVDQLRAPHVMLHVPSVTDNGCRVVLRLRYKRIVDLFRNAG
jgi:hypothetical protein